MARAKHTKPYSQVGSGASVKRGSGLRRGRKPSPEIGRPACPGAAHILITFRVHSALLLGRMARRTQAFGRQIPRHVGYRSRHTSLGGGPRVQQVEQRTVRFEARPKRQPSHGTAGLGQARRAANRKQTRSDLRCECDQSGCHAAVPAQALEHRRALRGGFVVFPGHQGQDVVVAAADRFFIIEPTQKQR